LTWLVIVFGIVTEEAKARFGPTCLNPFWSPRPRLNDISCTLDFASPDVDIRVKPILEASLVMKEVNSDWQVPEVKLMLGPQSRYMVELTIKRAK